MSGGSKSNFLFYLTGKELLEFFDNWPTNVALAILNEEERQRFYLLPQESAERDLQRLGAVPPLAVFPSVAGMPSISITYAQENEILSKLAGRNDLLAEAHKISERLLAAEKGAELEEDRESGRVATLASAPAETAAKEEEQRHLENLLTGFTSAERSEAHRISLLHGEGSLRLRLGTALLPAKDEEPLLGLLDQSGRRLAVLTRRHADALGLKGSAFQLKEKNPGPTAIEYELPNLPGLRAGRDEREQQLTLIGSAPGALVADLGMAVSRSSRRGWRSKGLMSAALAASWLLTLAAIGGYYRHVSLEAAPQVAATLPDFHSETYVENLVNRLFPDDDPAGS